MDVTGTIILAGAANAIVLGIASALNRRRHPAASWLCALFAMLSLTAAAILVQHRLNGLAERVAVTVEMVVAVAAAPTIYFYMRAATAASIRSSSILLHFAAPALVLLLGAPLTLSGISEPPPFSLTIGYMGAYSVGALNLFIRAWSRQGLDYRLAWPAAILATITLIHVGQIVRLASDSPATQDIVAVMGAAAAFGLLILALAVSLPWAATVANRYSRSPATPDDLQEAFRKLSATLEDQQLFRRPDLRLTQLASAAGMSPHLASQALSQAGRISFNELLASVRVEEAKRLMNLPENANVAVEPIGMMAGFRSRSSFYEAFRRNAGVTPADFKRNAHAPKSCPGQPGRTGKA